MIFVRGGITVDFRRADVPRGLQPQVPGENNSSRCTGMKIQNRNSNALRGMLSLAAGTLIAFLLLLAPLGTHAQSYSGSVRGTVTDPGGGAVPGATIILRNVGNNATVEATTSEDGVYSFGSVDVGVYEVTVKAASFKEFVAKNVEVHVSTPAEVNVKLTLGASNEIMTVEASDVQVQTTTADVGAVIEGTQIRELPLNGRNFMSLTQLQPGVSANNQFNSKDKGLQGGSDFSVNGNPSTNNLFLLDGVNNNDVGSNRTILIYPSVDSIAEFKMLTNSYGPEYGQASGAIISITTRSGENQFHGGLFYEGRNDALNANSFTSNLQDAAKSPLRRNDWGYFVGGPIKKDKLFFWFNEEWNRDNRAQLVTQCVPTAAERGGDFSADVTAALNSLNSFPTPLTDTSTPTIASVASSATTCNAPAPVAFTNSTPGTGNHFTATSNIPVGFQSPTNPFGIANPDAVGQLFAAYYPLPNQATVGTSDINFAQNQVRKAPWREENVRIDYNINKANRVTFRYTQDAWSIPAPNNGFGWGDDNFATYQGGWSQPSRSVLGRLTSQISNTLVNDFEFGYSHNAIIITPGGSDSTLSQQFDAALPPVWPASGKTAGGIPTVWGGLQNYGNFASIWAIVGYANHMNLFTYQDNLTKISGNHTWRFGGLYDNNTKVENQFGGADRSGLSLSNNPGWGQTISTGNALANVLLPGTGTPLPFTDPTCNAGSGATLAVGCPQQFRSISETNVNPVDHGHWHDIEFYVGDTWKIRPRLTLTYGLRWSLLREPYDDNNQFASFNLADYNPAGAPGDACNGVVVVPGTTFCQQAAATTGLPLSNGTPGVNRSLVNQNWHNIAPRVGIAWDVFGDGKTALRVGGGQFYQRERVSPQVGLSDTSPFAITAGNINRPLDSAPDLASSGASTSPSGGRSARGVTPNAWQWNLSVERELWRDTALQVGYVGNASIHQLSTYDINQVNQDNFVIGAFLPGGAATSQPFTTGPAGPVGGVCPPGGVFSAGGCTYVTPSINTLRPAGNFGAINFFSRDGHSSYHSLQVLFRTKFSKVSTLQAAYTWSHTIANIEEDAANGGASQGSFTDIQNLSLDRGNATINRPNIFVLNEVFFLPRLENKGLFVRETLGGWEFNTIFTAENGNSITVYQNGLGTAGALVDPTASPLNCSFNGNEFPCGVNALTGTGYGNNLRPNIVPGTSCNSATSGNQIFNPNAFTLIGYSIGAVGNEPLGYCEGPHYVNADMELSKNWKFKERFNLRFSMDFFNAFNHANFDPTFIQGTGANNGSGTFYNGGGVYCGSANAQGLFQPCGTSNNVISTYGTVNPGIGGANKGFGTASQTLPARELQYGLKLTF
jgi:hypothetical protein